MELKSAVFIIEKHEMENCEHCGLREMLEHVLFQFATYQAPWFPLKEMLKRTLIMFNLKVSEEKFRECLEFLEVIGFSSRI